MLPLSKGGMPSEARGEKETEREKDKKDRQTFKQHRQERGRLPNTHPNIKPASVAPSGFRTWPQSLTSGAVPSLTGAADERSIYTFRRVMRDPNIRPRVARGLYILR